MRSPAQSGHELELMRRGTRRRRISTLALATMALTSLALGGAGENGKSKRENARRDPAAAARALLRLPQPLGPDQVGGIVSGYVCIRAQPGVIAAQLPDGKWTLRRAQPADADAIALQESDLKATLARHRVTSIARFMNGEFKRPDLAAKYGLDRAYIAYVAAGADVVALNNELNGRFAALVERSELDSVGTIAAVPNDTFFNLQWNMHNIGQTVQGVPGTADADIDAPEAWDIHTGSASTIIAILDTGVQADHPDLTGKVIPGIDTYQAGSPNSNDLHGHGTHCAGNAAARGNDGIGIAGVNWNAQILAVRVTSATGSTNQTDVSEGVIYAADNSAHVISMSLQFHPPPYGMSSENLTLRDACAYAYDGGTLPVAAAGNFNAPLMAWPAAYPKCMAVGATNNLDVRWASSNTGADLDVVAPGQSVYSCRIPSTWIYDTGTSMATPHVAGLAGLIMSRNPALTVPQIEALIKNTSEDKGAAGFDNLYGWGRINLHSAMVAAAPACIGNTDGSPAVDINDLLAVLNTWGGCPTPPALCPGDVSPIGPPQGDGQVNINDLLEVINHWGPCP